MLHVLVVQNLSVLTPEVSCIATFADFHALVQ